MTAKQVAELMDKARITRVKLGGPDLDGVYRGKRVMAKQFLSGLEHGFPQCDCLFGWDVAETLIDGMAFTGWHTGFPDLEMEPDLDTFLVVPWEERTASVIADFHLPDGRLAPLAPRTVLREMVARAGKRGVRLRAAFELEFRLYRETPFTLREKGFDRLTPLSPTTSCYSIYRETTDEPVVGKIVDGMEAAGIPIEGYNREHGPGMYEINLAYADALTAADRTMLYKTGAKEICHREGVLASFMAKPFHTEDGMSGHLHLSLWDPAGERNLFAPQGAGLNETMGHALGGLLATLPDFMALYAPTVNSYKRYVAGTWAPTRACWGHENRTAAVRAILPTGRRREPRAARLENRVPGADAHPYLALSAALAGMLHGLERKIAPPGPITGNAYELPAERAGFLPRTLEEATARLERSEVARDYFDAAFLKDYVVTRRWEAEQARRVVGNWERERYLEII